MKPRSRRLILAVAVALLAGAAGLFLGNPPPTSQRLADGSTVSLLGITYGRNHVMVYGPFWQRPFARFLPEDVSRRLGFQFLSHTTTNDTLMVWTETTDRPVPAGGDVTGRVPPVVLSDGRGTELCETQWKSWPSFTNRVIKGTSFSMVPRGSDRLLVRVAPYKDEDEVKEAALFNVPNPVPRLRQTWRAPPFPVEANAGDLKFTLTGLKSRRLEERNSTKISTETWMTANYLFAEGSTATTNWCVVKLEILDEAGDRHQPSITSYGFDLTRKEYEFRAGLGTNVVWKLRFTLLRIGGFASNEIASVQRVPMPARGSGPSVPIALRIGGVNLSVYSDSDFTGKEVLSFFARLDPPDEDVELMALRMADNYGVNIGRYYTPSSFGLKLKGIYFWPIQPQRESEYINVTLALSRLRYVELLVRPEPPFKYSPSTFPATGK